VLRCQPTFPPAATVTITPKPLYDARGDAVIEKLKQCSSALPYGMREIPYLAQS
jgi:hypothetical protein